VVLERSDALTWLSLRNAPEVHIVAVDQLNTYDVLASDDVVFTQGAYEAFVGGDTSNAQVAQTIDTTDTTVEVETAAPAALADVETAGSAEKAEKADEVETDAKPELPKGAKAPLKSGGAPKGYEIKGNADSGLYHEPDGQWYDQTDAEFYFKSAEAAEAAGFSRAGGRADEEADQ
jgi:large subunit ribosomal protein L4